MSRIYLDNAATSWPKPDRVYDAVDHYQRRIGVPAGRGVYDLAVQLERTLDQTRHRLASLLGIANPQRLIWHYSGTDALNEAIFGVLKPGDHVVTSVCEHNSVLRPLRYLESQGMIEVTRLDADAEGRVRTGDVERSIQHNTRLVALVHVSNVTGAVQPIPEIATISRARGKLLLVDASQSAGHIPVRVDELGCDLLAAPGHKGLLGPLGTGLLYIGEPLELELVPRRLGGTGSQSESDQQPAALPDRFESGNLNVPGILGLGEGVQYVTDRGLLNIHQHELELTAQLLEGLRSIATVRPLGPSGLTDRIGVVSLVVDQHDPQELAMLLDQVAGIQVRAGFHCAPLMHQALKTDSTGGTLRVSFGPMNTAEDVDTLLTTLSQLVKIS